MCPKKPNGGGVTVWGAYALREMALKVGFEESAFKGREAAQKRRRCKCWGVSRDAAY